MTLPSPQPESSAASLRIAIAGASGFVGSALARRLGATDHVLTLGRRQRREAASERGAPREPGIEPRRCDLFSVRQTREALEGADVAVYLVHSMSPNARLTQGRFDDLDLLIADNFARAAADAGVGRIVYLGGLLPPDPDEGISRHLASRQEVERALAARGASVTAIRAGLVVGPEGSSLNLLVRLVERLPLMVCPSWTSSETQPIALSDVIEILAYCCHHSSTAGRVCEVGGPDVMTYREMMQTTAQVLRRRRPMLPVPFVSPALSELWVSLVTGASRSLVRPLIESLRHPMVVQDPWLQKQMGFPGRPFRAALADSVDRTGGWKRPIARSVQRLPLPDDRDADWLGRAYLDWLAQLFPALLVVDSGLEETTIRLRGMQRPLLRLRRRDEGESKDRCVLEVAGGLLAARAPEGDPRLEFRQTADEGHALAALQDFEPRLPWWLYLWTQAPLHATVMSAFHRWLRRHGCQPNEHEEARAC